MDFHKPLTFKQRLFSIFVILLSILFTISPLWTKDEPDIHLFIILWAIGFVFLLVNLSEIFSENENLSLPENYKELIDKYGKPIDSIKPRISKMGKLALRGFHCKVDIYTDFIIISYHNRAILIDKMEYLKIEDSIWFGITIVVRKNVRELILHLSKSQLNKIKNNLTWFK